MDCVKPDEVNNISVSSNDSQSTISYVLEKISKNKVIMTFIGLAIVALQSYLASFKS